MLDDNKKRNLKNRKFGKLKVVEKTNRKCSHNCVIWKCLCSCGEYTEVASYNLRNGHTRSCGCLRSDKEGKRYLYGSKHQGWTGYKGIIGTFWSRIKRNAKIRNIEFKISIEECWELWLQQEGKCKLSGFNIELPKSTKEHNSGIGTASLDRIDSSKGYTKDNIQWVHKEVNISKQWLNEKRFIEICGAVYKKYYNLDSLEKPF